MSLDLKDLETRSLVIERARDNGFIVCAHYGAGISREVLFAGTLSESLRYVESKFATGAFS